MDFSIALAVPILEQCYLAFGRILAFTTVTAIGTKVRRKLRPETFWSSQPPSSAWDSQPSRLTAQSVLAAERGGIEVDDVREWL